MSQERRLRAQRSSIFHLSQRAIDHAAGNIDASSDACPEQAAPERPEEKWNERIEEDAARQRHDRLSHPAARFAAFQREYAFTSDRKTQHQEAHGGRTQDDMNQDRCEE